MRKAASKLLITLAFAILPLSAQAGSCPDISVAIDGTSITLQPGSGLDCLGRALATCTPAEATLKNGARLGLERYSGDCRFYLSLGKDVISCSTDRITREQGFAGREEELAKAGKEPGKAVVRLSQAFLRAAATANTHIANRFGCRLNNEVVSSQGQLYTPFVKLLNIPAIDRFYGFRPGM